MSATMTLTELEQRAGASDQDREAWLAERRRGVTATEIRDLVLKGPAFRRELIELKLSRREDTFSGNEYTAWGKEREPIIARHVEDVYGIRAESRVFRAADNPRFLASPDGTGLDFDDLLVVSEIKTAGKDVAAGSAAFVEKGYLLQMQWVMRVTGARRCLYVWEERITVAGGFVPGQLHTEWVEYDPKVVEQLEREAHRFLAELDAAATAEGEPAIDDHLDTLAVNLLRFRLEESEGKRAKESTWAELLAVLADRGELSQESTLARVTWTPPSKEPGTSKDTEAARAAAPELYVALQEAAAAVATHEEAFVREVEVVKPGRLTVTAVKPKKGKETK